MRTCAVMLILEVVVSLNIYSQQVVPLDTNISTILGQMGSTDLHTQKLAFDELMAHVASESVASHDNRTNSESVREFIAHHPEQADKVKLALIQLLKTENHYFIESKNPPPDRHAEDAIGEHYAELIDVVSSLDDERAIPVLVGAMSTGGMATRGILKYGNKALEPVLQQLENPNGLVRATALGIAIALLEKQNDPASHARIRELLRSTLTDDKPVVRTHAIRQISCLPDRQDFVPALEQIAKTDTWKLPGRADDGEDGDEFFPVRADARAALRAIREGKSCTH